MVAAQVTDILSIIDQHGRFRDPTAAEQPLCSLRHVVSLRSRRPGTVLVCPRFSGGHAAAGS